MSDEASLSKYQNAPQPTRIERVGINMADSLANREPGKLRRQPSQRVYRDARTRSAKKAATSLDDVDSFLKSFDPERSEREKRKLNRRLYPGAKKHVLYDERGIFCQMGEDLCDCLERSCPGCHFPCPKCKSTKCGHECRSSRKWAYESIENEGSDVVIKNPVLKE